MSHFAETKGSIIDLLNKITDLLLLSLLFLLFSLPVITMGAAFSSLYYTVTKVNRHKRGYIWAEFTGCFKNNFKQATLTWLLFLGLGVILGGDLYFVLNVMKNSPLTAFLNIVFILLSCLVVLWGSFVFPYIARFKDSIPVTLKNAALIALFNFPKALLILLLVLGGAALIWLFFPLAVIVPAAAAMLQSELLEGIFRKYMSEEDRRIEDERNMEWPDEMK